MFITSWRSGGVLSVLFLVLAWAGCGETFRPVATPILPPPVSPGATHFVLALSGNGPDNPGASTRIDVSGDSNVGVAALGLGPVHAALLPNSSRIYVANFLEDTVSSFAPTSISPVTTTSLAVGAKPVFVHTTENGAVYVAGLGNNAGVPPAVYAISTANNAVVDPPIPVGANPVALAETPDGTKLYAVNQGDGTVTGINTATRTVTATIMIGAGSSPVWAVARPDKVQPPPSGFRVYVLNSGGGTVSTIDTSTDSLVPGIPPSVGAGANFMVYDPNRTRLYVTNPNSTNVMVLDASSSTDPPSPVNPPIDLKVAPPDAVSLCATQACHPVSITVLPDGSRAYVASYALVPAANPTSLEWQVSVVNTLDNTVRAVAPTDPSSTLVDLDTADATGCGGTRPFRLSLAASADSTKVYVASCDSGNIEIIRTSDDTLITSPDGAVVLGIPAPPSVFPPPTVTIAAASQVGSNTTYTYTLPPGQPPLRVGMNILITGMADGGNNGAFTLTAVSAGTFTVGNSSGVTASSQSGIGAATTSPPQNPVFMLAGP